MNVRSENYDKSMNGKGILIFRYGRTREQRSEFKENMN